MHHIIAIIAFLVCYFAGFVIALSGPGSHDVFEWAMLFGLAFGVPSLFFVGSSYLLFILIRWWATVLLLGGAAGIYFLALGAHSDGWNMAFAVVIATIVHQLALLALQKEKRPT